MKYRKAMVVGPMRVELFDEELPPLADDEVLLKTISVGMCHTDLPAFLGVMGISVSKYGFERLGVGEPSFPMDVGHEPIAEVIEVGKAVRNFHVGEYVGGFGGGFREYIVMKDDNRSFCEIPVGDKPVKYCCAEPLGCIVNIVKEATCQYGENIAVVGCGFMGLMVIAGLRKSGAKKLTAIDLLDNKLELAKKYGATHVLNPRQGEIDDLAWEMTDGRFFDVVVEITGSLKGLDTACKIIREPHVGGMAQFDGTFRGVGKVLIPSVYSREEIFPKSLAFNLMQRTPALIATHPTIAPRPRDNMLEGIASYMDGRLPCDELISHEFKFEQIQAAFEMLAHPEPDYIKGIVTF
ncbi:MAG: zinc-binding dehydrogenase [Eubacterium sp.]|nr:zinc-binding dehydrogenase [Eubacterium sp.]